MYHVCINKLLFFFAKLFCASELHKELHAELLGDKYLENFCCVPIVVWVQWPHPCSELGRCTCEPFCAQLGRWLKKGRWTKLPSVSTCRPNNQCWAFRELTAHTWRKPALHSSQGKPVSLIHHRKRKRKHFSHKWSGKLLCLGFLFSVSSDHKWFRQTARTQQGLGDRLASRSSGHLAWCPGTQPGQHPFSPKLQKDWLTPIPSRIQFSEPQQSDPPDVYSVAGMHL